jgi:hypothetical protein
MEEYVIVFGIGAAIIAITIHLILASRKAKAEQKKKDFEHFSSLKGGSSIVYPSSTTIKIKGPTQTTEAKVENKSSMGFSEQSWQQKLEDVRNTPKPKKKKSATVFNDYIVEEDKALLRRAESNDGSFLTSMLVAEATDSTILGTIVGGDPLGAMVGDMMNDSDIHTSNDSSWESNDSNDYSSSSDSYSSSDSTDYSSSDSSSSDW